MRRLIPVLALAVLAACGADGEPVTPTSKTGVTLQIDSQSGLRLSGRAGIGVRIGG